MNDTKLDVIHIDGFHGRILGARKVRAIYFTVSDGKLNIPHPTTSSLRKRSSGTSLERWPRSQDC